MLTGAGREEVQRPRDPAPIPLVTQTCERRRAGTEAVFSVNQNDEQISSGA